MADGIGCACSARCEGECACAGVDWTPSSELALRNECNKRGLEIERLNSALDWLKTESKMLGDLLATIHRDGGDYVRGHGIVQAFADAQQIASDHAAEIARLTEQCSMLLSRPAYAAGYREGVDFGISFATHRAAAQIEARAAKVGEQPWYGAIASELYAMAEKIRNEQ